MPQRTIEELFLEETQSFGDDGFVRAVRRGIAREQLVRRVVLLTALVGAAICAVAGWTFGGGPLMSVLGDLADLAAAAGPEPIVAGQPLLSIRLIDVGVYLGIGSIVISPYLASRR
jgi:hypothetical protein